MSTTSTPRLLEDALEEKRARIVAKLRAKRRLTKDEMDFLAGVPSKEEKANFAKVTSEREKSHSSERAEFWCVRLRSMQNMIADGVPVDDPAAMVVWFAKLTGLAQSRIGADFKRRLAEERAKLNGGKTPETGDGDFADFENAYHPSATDEKDNLAEIRRQCAYYLFKMKRSRERRDSAGEAEAAKLYKSFSDTLHDCELRAMRLGRDLGESFSAGDVDRLGMAIGFWLMNAADGIISQTTSALVAATAFGPIDREAVRKAVEPIILGECVLVPLVRATQVSAPAKLPVRFVDAVKAGLGAVTEDGVSEFEKLYATQPQIGAA